MTTIAYRNGVMAADTQMIKGSTVFGHTAKVVRRSKDGALCGGAGNLGWVQAFHRWFLDGEEGSPPPLSEYDNGIIARKGSTEVEIFEQCGSFDFEPNYTAIGSGKEFALGAMAFGAEAADAIQIAILLDPGTGGEVIKIEHGEPSDEA